MMASQRVQDVSSEEKNNILYIYNTIIHDHDISVYYWCIYVYLYIYVYVYIELYLCLVCSV